MKIKKSKVLLLSLLMINAVIFIAAQEFPVWEVPEAEKQVENPLESSINIVDIGRSFYDVQCKSCHGPKADGNGVIPAASLITEEFTAQSDGAIFWKLKEGRGQMPSFAAQEEEKLWSVIHYLRWLVDPTEQVVKKATKIVLKLNDLDTIRTVEAQAFGVEEDGSEFILPNVKIILGVKRMFGVLPFSQDDLYTDAEGKVFGVFPDDIPTDTAGRVIISASIDNLQYEAGTVEQSTDWGQEWEWTNITEERSLWARNRYAPIWLMITFFGGLGLAWGMIMLVMLRLKKINDTGKKIKG